MRRPIAFLTIVLGSALLLGGCTQNSTKEEPGSASNSTQTSHSAPSSEPAASGELTVAGVHFDVPEGWSSLGATQMRQAQFRIDPVEGDSDAPEVNVFYFGAQSGTIESNIARWIGQMQSDSGSDAIRSKLTNSHGVDVHFVEMDGTYMETMGGGPMTGGKKVAHPGYRMVAAIVNGPQGNVYLKLTGPEKSARAMEEGLREMVGSAHAEH